MLPLRWAVVLLMAGGIAAAPACAEDVDIRLRVEEAYLELHTGPGQGYPITQVVERGEWIGILLRRTDWFKVRTDSGKEGWASRAGIEATVTAAGAPLRLRDALYEDYRRRRFEAGFAGGTLEGDPYLMVRVGYRFSENLTGEWTLGRAAGEFSSKDLYYAALLSEPFPEWRVSPFFSLGLGRFNDTPKATLVGATRTESNMGNAALGARFYLTRRFVLRGEYRRHVVFVDQNRINDYNELSLGISLFFY